MEKSGFSGKTRLQFGRGYNIIFLEADKVITSVTKLAGTVAANPDVSRRNRLQRAVLILELVLFLKK